MEIVKHFALVAGLPDGEDHAGRAKIALMASTAVAARANGIADAIVGEWEVLGWIRATTQTAEEDWTRAGELERLKARSAWPEAHETGEQREARLKAREERIRAAMTAKQSEGGDA
jgi:hypothetical protein